MNVQRKAMRHFPFKMLILCVLLPPLVYVFSIQLIEKSLRTNYDEALSGAYTGDTSPLFDGSVRLQDAIRENVDAFIASRKMIEWGVRINITVKTPDGVYLYPEPYDGLSSGISPLGNMDVARENFRLLKDGLIKTVAVEIKHNCLISNLLLFSCIAAALLVLAFSYRRGIKMIHRDHVAKQEIIDNLSMEREKSLSQLERLESQRMLLAKNIDSMKAELDRERQKTSDTEDEMIDELVVLEEKIKENQDQQSRQLHEISELKERIKQFEKEGQTKNRQRFKIVDTTGKRFATLYKGLVVNDRAVEGFVELTEEMRIKAEEVIHQLNDDPKIVQIKRKVFGKKNRETVFEVIFAYKGRLYFRTLSGHRVEVLVIGTKLTQNKDLAFLNKL